MLTPSTPYQLAGVCREDVLDRAETGGRSASRLVHPQVDSWHIATDLAAKLRGSRYQRTARWWLVNRHMIPMALAFVGLCFVVWHVSTVAPLAQQSGRAERVRIAKGDTKDVVQALRLAAHASSGRVCIDATSVTDHGTPIKDVMVFESETEDLVVAMNSVLEDHARSVVVEVEGRSGASVCPEGWTATVTLSAEVTIRYTDENGDAESRRLTGDVAMCAQQARRRLDGTAPHPHECRRVE